MPGIFFFPGFNVHSGKAALRKELVRRPGFPSVKKR